ncbi:Eco57I restriction-modification methylase domain-containing protein [Persicobacter psychrovividus]|uniref:site-specific DNA-methyltransferase (adenine-specific) n=1 Tax=Persicobacter psychrovividus TaxID=387638 RepID=A0ABN6LLE6_9BACT|nr:hypothetical protein PEPS_47120 [Persicobacter psychrovividus]
MERYLNTYNKVISDYLTLIQGEIDLSNPIELNRARFDIRLVFTCSIFYIQQSGETSKSSVTENAVSWYCSRYGNKSFFFLSLKTSDKYLLQIVDKHLSQAPHEPVSIISLYENLLGLEGIIAKEGIIVNSGKNYRNKLGSYFTPPELARSSTNKCLGLYIRNNLDNDLSSTLSNCKIVDFSCGAGIFLIKAIKEITTLLSEKGFTKKEIQKVVRGTAQNIYGCDVDRIALELALLNVLEQAQSPDLYEAISPNFTFGNFLLHTGKEENNTTKLRTLRDGFIYHEHLALDINKFPNFDIILGNPPWEKIRFEEKKFLDLHSGLLEGINFKGERKKVLTNLQNSNPVFYEYIEEFKAQIDNSKTQIKNNKEFALSSHGELNTYALFTELASSRMAKNAVVGLILKSAIGTSPANKKLFNHLVEKKKIDVFSDFVNKKKIFAIDSRERFCLLILSSTPNNVISVSMNLQNVSQLHEDSQLKLKKDDIWILSPNTGMLPNISSPNELRLLLKIGRKNSIFDKRFPEVKFGRIVHFTNHSDWIIKGAKPNYIPIYEGKFIHQFNGRFAGFNGMSDASKYKSKSMARELNQTELNNPDIIPESRFYIESDKWGKLSRKYGTPEYMLSWRSLTSPTNQRTCIATILPFVPASQSVQFLTSDLRSLLLLCGLFNSFTFDFLVRKMISGIDLTQTVIKQIPVPPIDSLSKTITIEKESYKLSEFIELSTRALLTEDSRLTKLKTETVINFSKNFRSKEYLRLALESAIMYCYQINIDDAQLILSDFTSINENQVAIILKYLTTHLK